MYVVYALKSLSTAQIYIGQTNAIERRLKEHNSGVVRSTKMKMPWQLIAIQEVGNRSEARWIERSLKNSHEKRNRWLQEFGLALTQKRNGGYRASRSESEVSE